MDGSMAWHSLLYCAKLLRFSKNDTLLFLLLSAILIHLSMEVSTDFSLNAPYSNRNKRKNFDGKISTSAEKATIIRRAVSVVSGDGILNDGYDARIKNLIMNGAISPRRKKRSATTGRVTCFVNGQWRRRWPLLLGVLLPESYRRRIEPSIDLALEHVHSTSNLLADYCLKLIYKDTQCKTSLGMKSLFDLMNTGGVDLGGASSATILPDHSSRFSTSASIAESESNKELDELMNRIDYDESAAVKDESGESVGGDVGIRPAALFGDVCTDVNEPVAMTSKYWDILHLSYAETHSKFSTADSKDLYPTFFRIVPGDRNLIRARCHLVKFFHWTRVATIKQSDEPFYSLPHERLTTVLENTYNVRVIYTAGLSNDQINNIANELEELKRRDAHIIIGDFSARLALHVLCEAFHLGMYGAGYLWILPGYHNADWWRQSISHPATANYRHEQQHDGDVSDNDADNVSDDDSHQRHAHRENDSDESDARQQQRNRNGKPKLCTTANIQTVLQWHFAIEFAPLRTYSSFRIVSNKTVTQVQRELRELCQRKQTHCPDDVHRAYAYDGIWTLALALNATLYNRHSSLASNTSSGREKEKRFSKPILASNLLPYVESTSFEGLTGRVRFENNERLGLVHILQWANGSYSKVGFYDSAELSFYLQPLSGWSSPLDATVVIHERQYVSYYLLGIMSLLSLIGICLALIFFFINVKFRNHRFIKMSSPNMNNLIIVGSIFAYTAVFLLGVDTRFVSDATFEKLCYAKTWVLSVGFTLAFGAMFSKTWRVHSIFTNIRRDKKAIKDTQLFLIVAAILLLDVIILGAWALLSPFRFSIFELHAFRHKNVLIVPELERCVSEFSVLFQVIFYVFKGMLMLFGCFLAWETRAVNVPALNDSKYIGMCVYLVVVICVVGLSLAFVLQERLNEAFVLISFFIVFCTTLTLLLVFMPKVIELIRARGTDQQKRYNHKRLMKSMVGHGESRQGSAVGSVIKRGAAAGSIERLSRELSFSSEGADTKEKICTIEQDNLRLHEILIAKSTELWELLERLRVLGETIRSENGGENGDAICVGAQLTSSVMPTNEFVDEFTRRRNEDRHVGVYRTNTAEHRQRVATTEAIRTGGDKSERTSGEEEEEEDEEEEVLLFADNRHYTPQSQPQQQKKALHDERNEAKRFRREFSRQRADSECPKPRDAKQPRRKQGSMPAGLCGLLQPTTGEMAKSGTMLALTLIAVSDASLKTTATAGREEEDEEAENKFIVDYKDHKASNVAKNSSKRHSKLFGISSNRIRRSTTTFEYHQMNAAGGALERDKRRRDTSIPLSLSTGCDSRLPTLKDLEATSKQSKLSVGSGDPLHSSSEIYYEAASNFGSKNKFGSFSGLRDSSVDTTTREEQLFVDEDDDENEEDSAELSSKQRLHAARNSMNAYRLLQNSCSASSSMQSVPGGGGNKRIAGGVASGNIVNAAIVTNTEPYACSSPRAVDYDRSTQVSAKLESFTRTTSATPAAATVANNNNASLTDSAAQFSDAIRITSEPQAQRTVTESKRKSHKHFPISSSFT